MKISSIREGVDHYSNNIRMLFDGPIMLEHHGQDLSSSRLFIESVSELNILSEADQLYAMFVAGLEKLRAAITPGSSDESVDALLAFMAPNGGGVEALDKLLNTPANPAEDDNFWNELYTIFNITDSSVQEDIKRRVTDEYEDTQQRPEPGEERQQEQQQEPEGRGYEDRGREPAGRGRGQKGRGRRKPANFVDRFRSAHNKFRESDYSRLSKAILELHSVRSNLPIISERMRDRLSPHLPDITERNLRRALNEAEWLDNLRTRTANPKYAEGIYKDQGNKAVNERMVKLAVKIAKDHIREKFNAKLQDAGLLPKDIIKQFVRYRAISADSNPSQRDLAEKRVLEGKLGPVAKMFGMALKSSGEDVVDAELVGDEPFGKKKREPEPYSRKFERAKESSRKAQEKPRALPDNSEKGGEENAKRGPTEQEKKVVYAIAKKMAEIAQKTEASGNDPEYAIRSYLIGIKRKYRGIDKIADGLFDMWRRSRG
jgi:hypothetical protein